MNDVAVRADINGMALCAGFGGLELGLKLALGDRYRCRVYVEREAYAAATLVARMEDATLDSAPVWDSVESFDGRPWRGVVDLVSAGFPCQPHSVAGKRRGKSDERWIWPDIARIVREVEPRYVFLENVPALVSSGLGDVLRDLALCGFDAEWDVFSAAQVGAPQLRERLFILAHAHGEHSERRRIAGILAGEGRSIERETPQRQRRGNAAVDRGADVANADCDGLAQQRRVEKLVGQGQEPRRHDADGRGGQVADVADAKGIRRSQGGAERQGRKRLAASVERSALDDAGDVANSNEGGRRAPERDLHEGQWDTLGLFPPNPRDLEGWRAVIERAPGLEPAVRRLAYGYTAGLESSPLAYRTDQLRVLGNSVMPLTAALAFTVLQHRLV